MIPSHRFSLGLILALLPAVASAQSAPKDASERLLERAESIQKDVEAMRGLKFRTAVPKGVQKRSDMKRSVISQMTKELNSQKSLDGARLLKLVGLIPQDFDMGKGVAEFYGSQIGGYYDPEAKRLFLIASDSGEAVPGQEMQDDFVMAHELCHALQDQHFDLSRWMRLFMEEEDRLLSFKACVEGEAMLVGFDWLAKKQPMLGNMSLRQFLQMNKQMSQTMPDNPQVKKLAKMPRYLIESAMFPYTEGGIFVEEVKKARGWDGVTELFRAPPMSTEQILHPEKYLGDTPDTPVVLRMSKLADALGDGYEERLRDAFGEYQMRLLFEIQGLETKDAHGAADGWGGDHYQFIRHEASKRDILVWLTTWDNDREAQEFFSAHRKVLDKLHADRESRFTLRRRGQRVLLIEGATAAEQLKLERLAFEALEERGQFVATPSMLALPPISDFEDAKRSDPNAPGLTGAKVEKSELGLEFQLPTAEWKVAEENVDALRQFSRGRYTNGSDTQELRLLELPFPYNEQRMGTQLEMLARQGIQGYKRLGNDTMTLGGRRCMRVDVEGVPPGEQDVNRVTLVAVDNEGSTVLLLFRAPPANWSEAGESFEGLLASLRFEGSSAGTALVDGQRIESRGGLLSLVIPKGWERRGEVEKNTTVAAIGDGDARVVVTHFESPSRQDPKALARAFEAQAKLVYPGFEKVRGGFLEISGETAYCLDFMSSNEAGRRRVRQVVLGLSAGSEMHVTMSCDAASNDRYSDVFKGLTASLELLNPEARAPVIGADKLRKVAPKKSRNSKVKLY